MPSTNSNQTQDITLYAYRIESNHITTNKSDMVDNLIRHFEEKQENNGARQHKPKVNSEDTDILSYYKAYKQSKLVFGVIMRIAPVDTVPDLPPDFFDKEQFNPKDITKDKFKENGFVCKKITYFMVNETHLITNIPPSRTKQLLSYINWFLEIFTGKDNYKIAPLIIPFNSPIRDVKRIVFGSSSNKSKPAQCGTTGNKQISQASRIFNLTKECFKNLVESEKDLDVLVDKKILDAKLVVNLDIQRTKDMADDEDVKKALSAVIGNLSEDSDVDIETKEGTKVHAGKLQRTRNIKIDLLENGTVDENQLSYEMETFISSLKGILR